jgi:membrane associated rhomboid family serine protease
VSETELSVICKNCGSEVSPYVTECPYCGARLRKRAPKLEQRGEGLEAKRSRRRHRRPRPAAETFEDRRPYVTLSAVLAGAVLLLVQRASGNSLETYGGLVVPLESDPWRYLTAPFAYSDVGYLFVVAVALVLFVPALERRLGTFAAALLLLACGALGTLAAYGIEEARDSVVVIAGGNGVALGALAAWFAIRRAEVRGAIDEELDRIGVLVVAAVLLLLPIFDDAANLFAGVVGGLVGGLAGVAAAALRPAD